MLNTVTNGNSKDYHQNIRIQFKSNESANVWEISGYPPSLRIEDAVDRPNTELEKNKSIGWSIATRTPCDDSENW